MSSSSRIQLLLFDEHAIFTSPVGITGTQSKLIKFKTSLCQGRFKSLKVYKCLVVCRWNSSFQNDWKFRQSPEKHGNSRKKIFTKSVSSDRLGDRPLETKPWQWLKSFALSRSTKKGCPGYRSRRSKRWFGGVRRRGKKGRIEMAPV